MQLKQYILILGIVVFSSTSCEKREDKEEVSKTEPRASQRSSRPSVNEPKEKELEKTTKKGDEEEGERAIRLVPALTVPRSKPSVKRLAKNNPTLIFHT